MYSLMCILSVLPEGLIDVLDKLSYNKGLLNASILSCLYISLTAVTISDMISSFGSIILYVLLILWLNKAAVISAQL